jgi:hypothetical protein
MNEMTQVSDIGRRTRITRPYPSYTLQDSVSVAKAIYEVNAGLPFDRELLAGALGTTPKSSAFTMRLNSSAAYGLTEGGYNDPDIRLTNLGETVVAGDGEDARVRALAEAAMTPETFAGFYELLDGRKLPQSEYLHNILQRQLGVRPDLAEECLGILQENGEFAGIILEVDGEFLVRLPEPDTAVQPVVAPGKVATELPTPYQTGGRQPDAPTRREPVRDAEKRIFIGQIGDSDAARYVASMLEELGVSTASPQIPEGDADLLVPQNVSQAMRESGAAILVFRSGDNAWSSRDKMIGMLGAASVLFDDRVVLLHESGEQMNIGLNELNHIDFDRERPGESGLKLLIALHKSGVIKVSA